MAKWGAMAGVGAGAAQAGSMLMADRLNQMKEERLRSYQQEDQQAAWERDDQIRAQDQANIDREFGQRQSVVEAELRNLGYEGDIREMELSREQVIQKAFDAMKDAQSPEELETLRTRYQALQGEGGAEYKFYEIPKYDELGNRVGTEIMTHNTRTNEISRFNDDGGDNQIPSIESLLGNGSHPAPGNSEGDSGGLMDRPAQRITQEQEQLLGDYEESPSLSQRFSGLMDRARASGSASADPYMTEGQGSIATSRVKEMIDSGSLPGSGPLNNRMMRTALESGELSEEQAQVLRAHMQRIGIL